MAEFTQRELDRQISEYEDSPMTRQTARDLSALYIIRDYLFPEPETVPAPGRSFTGPVSAAETIVGSYGESDFLRAVSGKGAADAWRAMDQLVDTLSAVSPPLYRQVLQSIKSLP